MKFTRLTPNIFYTNISDGLLLFVDCLQFVITHNELDRSEPFCVIEKDGLGICLFQSKEFAEKDRPELRLQTNNINEVFEHVQNSFPQLLHPNSSTITIKPWGAREFALLDASGVCIIVQQWEK